MTLTVKRNDTATGVTTEVVSWTFEESEADMYALLADLRAARLNTASRNFDDFYYVSETV